MRDTVAKVAGDFQVRDGQTQALEVYDPNGAWKSTYEPAGGIKVPSLNADGTLRRLTDANGKFISFTYILPPGRTAGAESLIKTITNTTGQTIVLNYDANWNLATLTWPDGKVKTFLY